MAEIIVVHDGTASTTSYDERVVVQENGGTNVISVGEVYSSGLPSGAELLAAIAAHEADANNPHSVTAVQVGAEPAITGGTATQVWTGLKTWAEGVWLNVANTWTALQTFSAGIKTPTIAPLADATDAIKMTTAAGTAVLTVDTTNQDVWLGSGVQYDATYKTLALTGTSAGYGVTLPNNCAYSVMTSTGAREQVFRITATNHIHIGPISWSNNTANAYVNGNQNIYFRTRNAAANGYETSMTIQDQEGGVDFPYDIRVAGTTYANGNTVIKTKTSASATATGTTGEIEWDAS